MKIKTLRRNRQYPTMNATALEPMSVWVLGWRITGAEAVANEMGNSIDSVTMKFRTAPATSAEQRCAGR